MLGTPSEYSTTIPFEFQGTGRDFFRIWTVNLFLSLLTLGIYSAWAKVRTQRYLYSHLYLDDTPFEYLANPINILVGRLIAGTLVLTYVIAPEFFPALSVWIVVAAVPLVPWIILKSLQFRARNSAYRNIRFGFQGSYWAALFYFMTIPIMVFAPLVLLSLFMPGVIEVDPEDPAMLEQQVTYSAISGALFLLALPFFPFFLQRAYQYTIAGSSFGDARFQFRSRVNEYVGLVFKFIGLSILLVFGIALVYGIGVVMLFAVGVGPQAASIMVLPLVLPLYLLLFAAWAAWKTNLMYNGLVIPSWYTFKSTATMGGFFKIYFINTSLIILTLGIYIPWAVIRMIRYRVSCLEFVSTQPLDNFLFNEDPEVNAAGQEAGDMFDLGIGL